MATTRRKLQEACKKRSLWGSMGESPSLGHRLVEWEGTAAQLGLNERGAPQMPTRQWDDNRHRLPTL